jgi:hypothetical protein
MYFELYWKEQKYKLILEGIGNDIWYSERNKNNSLFLLETRSKLVRGEMDIHISITSMKNHLSCYFREVYEKTTEYKLKNIYK